jgi:GAF domain-containing protein
MTVLAGVAVLALLVTAGAFIWTSRQWSRARRAWEARLHTADQHALDLDASIRRLSAWLESLPELVERVQAAGTPEAAAGALAESLGHLLPTCHVLVLGREPGGRLVGHAVHRVPTWLVRQTRDAESGHLAALAARSEPEALDEAAWQTLGRPELTPHLPGRVTAVPLRSGGQSAGLVLLSTGRPEPLPSLHLVMVRLLCDAAAAPLAGGPATAPTLLPAAPAAPTVADAARQTIDDLSAELEHAFAEITAFLSTDEAIDLVAMSVERTAAARPDAATVLTIITRAFQHGLMADASTIHRGGEHQLVLQAHAGLELAHLTALLHQPAEALGQAALLRRATPGQHVPATGHRAHLAVPIVRGQHLLGVASVYWQQPRAVTSQDLALGSIFAGLTALALDNIRLYEVMTTIVERATAVLRDREAIVAQFLTALGTLADGCHATTASAGHARHVADWASAIARRLGLPAAHQAAVRAAALVHDLGYLNAMGADPTDPTNLAVAHPRWAASFLDQLPFLRGLAPAVLHHHEHYDGSGFPQGLAGQAIPFGARILAVANAFVVLTSLPAPGRIAPLPLPPSLPCSAAQALVLIQGAAGRQFDPLVVQALEAEVVGTSSLVAPATMTGRGA